MPWKLTGSERWYRNTAAECQQYSGPVQSADGGCRPKIQPENDTGSDIPAGEVEPGGDDGWGAELAPEGGARGQPENVWANQGHDRVAWANQRGPL